MANFWILNGPEKNWKVAFKKNKWGVRRNLKPRWKKLSPSDILGFYVTEPIGGVVGFGKVTKIREEKTPYWPDEVHKKQVIWPFRFYFKSLHRLPNSDWKEKKLFIKDFKLPYRGRINRVTNEEVIQFLLERASKVWGVDSANLVKKIAIKEEKDKYFYGDLLEGEGLEEIAKEKKKKHRRETIPKELKKVYLKDGWEIERELKDSLWVRKEKECDELLEDEVWLLFKKMGFTEMNKDRKLEIKAGARQKQIDVFAKDEKNIFIIECKASRAKSGSRNLLPIIHEILDLKPDIIESIRKHYGTDFRFSFLLITRNIKWSETAEKLAIDSRKKGFFFWKEAELKSYVNLANLFGETAKFQMYSILFPGKKFSELGEIKVPAILSGTGKNKFYSFIIQPERLLRVAYVHRREQSGPGETSDTYQRIVKESRLREIRKFIESGGFFPNNIILNFTHKPTFEPFGPKSEFEDIAFGILKFPPYYKSAWVIDGQHRLYGYKDTKRKETANLLVVAFDRLDVKDQANLFVEINKKQKAVSTSLLWDLYPDIYEGSEDPRQQLLRTISLVVKKLNFDSSSPLYKNVKIPSLPEDIQREAKLTLENVCRGIEENRLVDRESHLLFEESYKDTVDFAFKRIKIYFEIWRKVDEELLLSNMGIRIFLRILKQLLLWLKHEGLESIYKKGDLTDFKSKTNEILKPVFEEVRNMSNKDRKEVITHSSGKMALEQAQKLLWNLYQEYRFGAELWRKGGWTPEIMEGKKRIKGLIEETEIKLIYFIIENLKEIYGKKWWRQGVPGGVKIYTKKVIDQDEKLTPWEKRKLLSSPPEDKLIRASTSHWKEIIIYGNNWEKFIDTFSKDKENVTIAFKYFEAIRNKYLGHPVRIKQLDEITKNLGYWNMMWIRKCIGLDRARNKD